MRLIHYSEEILDCLYPCSYLQEVHMKPSGFWVSVEDIGDPEDNLTWPEWCESEEFKPERLRYAHEIRLCADANLLHLSTTYDMLVFNKSFRKLLVKGLFSNMTMDWPSVVEQYQGILIAPYHFNLRGDSDFFWYFGWDCSSGVIWDLEAIASIELIEL